jgi:hypothetical protein
LAEGGGLFMKKIAGVLTLSLVITVSAFAQNKRPLDGRYNETSSIANVNGEDLFYWLYRLPSYMTFDDLVAELCEYLEHRYEFQDLSPGWPIYWDSVQEWKPNPNLAAGVKTMMTRLKRNVSVHIRGLGGNYPPNGMIINYGLYPVR